MHYGLLLFIFTPRVWCSRARPPIKRRVTVRNTSCTSINWWLSTQRRLKRAMPELYLCSFSCHYAYSRKKRVWPRQRGEAYCRWFIVPWQAKAWNDNWRPVCSVRRGRSDWDTAVKRQDKEYLRRNSRCLPARCSTSFSRFAVLLRLQALSLSEESCALVLKVDLIHISALFLSNSLPQDDILKAQF